MSDWKILAGQAKTDLDSAMTGPGGAQAMQALADAQENIDRALEALEDEARPPWEEKP
jgi:hypothetical protein